jgi:cell division protein FtsW (lipid II flippase)
VSAQAFARWRLTLPLAIPSLGGLAYLAAFEASTRLIAINAGALVLALVWAMFGRMPSNSTNRLALAGLAALALTLPVLIGPEVGGVSRWLPAGPLLLHSGALLLPLITVQAAREAKVGPILLMVAGASLVLQPDAGALLGLGLASAVLAAMARSLAHGIVSVVALGLAAATFGAGTLEPQEFTEGVLAQVWHSAPLFALALGGLLFLAPAWLLARSPQVARAEGAALAALLCGLGIAAVLAPFPFPLIGYGASPILGFGLALGAIAARGHDRDAFRVGA